MNDAGRARGAVEEVPAGVLPPDAARGAEPRGRAGQADAAGPAYLYPAKLLYDIDGDTVKLALQLHPVDLPDASLGFHVYIENGWVTVHESLRLIGLNAAEHGTVAGDAATTYVHQWFAAAGPRLEVSTVKDAQEKYGRFLATVRDGHGRNLNDDLLATGHALVWNGRGGRPV